jgi:tetratricopeptide (TPR) repeat protein
MNSMRMNLPAAFQLAARQESEGKPALAEETYRQILEAQPQNTEALHGLSLLAIRQKKFTKARDLLQLALTVNPGVPKYHHNLATCCKILGRFKEAENHYQTAIRLQPDYAEAYFNLCAVRKFTSTDTEVSAIEELLGRTDLSTQDRSFLHFAAGKMYDDAGEYERAFGHYEHGNLLEQTGFDSGEHHRFVEKLAETFDANTLAARFGQGYPSELPVFVVGMPRSGTTLVEQILASHAKVFGAGELPDIPSIADTLPKHSLDDSHYPECLNSLEPEVLHGFGEAYLKRIQMLGKPAGEPCRIVDKNPMNHQHLGLIALLLPKARVIHCRRDPLDTCLSCYFQRFKHGHNYSNDLGNLGFYYRAYERLMEHWRTALPIPILEVDYESVVTDQEKVTRRLTDFCELEWDEGCLQFHQARRTVETASNWQVRQPIYRSAVNRWQNYAAHLGPLHEALECNRRAVVENVHRHETNETERFIENGTSQALVTAVGHNQAGRFAEAQRMYREILQAQPRHADALHLLGLTEHQQGRHQAAVEWIGRALVENPHAAPFHNNIAECYRQLQRTQQAIDHFQQAIRLDPNYPDPQHRQQPGDEQHRDGQHEGRIAHFPSDRERRVQGPGDDHEGVLPHEGQWLDRNESSLAVAEGSPTASFRKNEGRTRQDRGRRSVGEHAPLPVHDEGLGGIRKLEISQQVPDALEAHAGEQNAHSVTGSALHHWNGHVEEWFAQRCIELYGADVVRSAVPVVGSCVGLSGCLRSAWATKLGARYVHGPTPGQVQDRQGLVDLVLRQRPAICAACTPTSW